MAREWHTAAGVGNNVVVAGGRVDISDVEPPTTPMHLDSMCHTVEMLKVGTVDPRPVATGSVGMLQSLRSLHKKG